MPTGKIMVSTLNRPASAKPLPTYANMSNTRNPVPNRSFIIFVKKYAYLKYASRPKSIATDKQSQHLAINDFCLLMDDLIRLAINQSDNVINANISRNNPLVL